MMRSDFLLNGTLVIFFVLNIGLGVLFTLMYQMVFVEDEKRFDGVRIGSQNQTQALRSAYELDSYANWVCVNVKNMPYDRAIEVCKHEVGHEIFAVACAKNETKCLEIVEVKT